MIYSSLLCNVELLLFIILILDILKPTRKCSGVKNFDEKYLNAFSIFRHDSTNATFNRLDYICVQCIRAYSCMRAMQLNTP